MAPSDRFKPIQQIADTKERKAAVALGEAIKKRDAAEKQLQDLKDYHADYLQRFLESSKRGISGTRLHEYQIFLDKLELAIKEQEQAVVIAKQACTNSKQAWAGTYTKKQAMHNAVDRMKASEEHDKLQGEQKETDELGGRRRGR